MFRLLLVLSFVIGYSDQAALDSTEFNKSIICPSTQNISPPGEGKYYLHVVHKVNWYEAMHLCHSMNMRFATISNQEEYDILISMIKETNMKVANFWISASDMISEGTYLWATTGKLMTYSNWAPGEPNNYNHNGVIEHCVEIELNLDYKMNDDLCSKDKFFICEY